MPADEFLDGRGITDNPADNPAPTQWEQGGIPVNAPPRRPETPQDVDDEMDWSAKIDQWAQEPADVGEWPWNLDPSDEATQDLEQQAWEELREQGATAATPSPPKLPKDCLLYTSPSPRDVEESRMPSSA